jgi:hypothetical protein
LSDSSEPSSFNGVRHFWQYMMSIIMEFAVLSYHLVLISLVAY